VTNTFFLSLHVNFRPHGTTRLLLDGIFGEILCQEVVTTICRENSSLIKIGQKAGTLHGCLLAFITTVELGYNVVKGTKYFVSL
jgi:hypothetical protein